MELFHQLFFVFLLQDKRNFLRNPPAGVQFQFDFESMFPVAMATLQEDENLNKMRFELVPKQYVHVFISLYTLNYFTLTNIIIILQQKLKCIKTKIPFL